MGKRYLSVNYINDLSFKEPIMTKLNTISIVMLSALFLTPLVVQAAETAIPSKAQIVQSKIETNVVSSPSVTKLAQAAQATDSSFINARFVAQQPAIVPQDKSVIVVTNEMGELHFNRIIDTENLTEVSTDFTVVDTYTFTHEGRTYTNKIVAD